MPTKKKVNKLSQVYKTIDQRELSQDAKNALTKLRVATGNFRKSEGKEADAFMLFYNRLVSKKPTAVKTTPEYKAMIKERQRENGRKMLEAKKAKQESRQGQGSERDASRPAKPFGWRLKGKHNYRKPTRADISSGRAYYEARINRADSKRTKFPMLERGGYMEHGGDVDKGGMIYALREFVSSGEIANRTDVLNYDDIAKIRRIAIQYYMDNGDQPYSYGELNRIMVYANDKFKSGYMEHGGVVDKDGMIYALRELVPSMEISKKTNVDYWSGIEFIRQRAIEYYINNGDVPYSDEELDRVLTMIGWEYGTFEGYMANGGEIQDLKSKIEQIDKYLKKLENENTQEAYEKSNDLRDYKNFLQAKVLHLEDEKMAEGGETKFDWMKAQAGDSAVVIEENKMGVIVKPYGRRFHLRFPDGSEKTYFAEELYFIFDEEYAKGGTLSKSTYVSNRNIGELYLTINNTPKTIKGKDLLDGVYVKNSALKTPRAKFDARKVQDELSNMAYDVWDKLKIESGSQIYASKPLQVKLAKYFELKGIDEKYLKLTPKQRIEVSKILTDENQHSLNNYLALRGYRGDEEYQSYVRIFEMDKKRPNGLNPEAIERKLSKEGDFKGYSYAKGGELDEGFADFDETHLKMAKGGEVFYRESHKSGHK